MCLKHQNILEFIILVFKQLLFLVFKFWCLRLQNWYFKHQFWCLKHQNLFMKLKIWFWCLEHQFRCLEHQNWCSNHPKLVLSVLWNWPWMQREAAWSNGYHLRLRRGRSAVQIPRSEFFFQQEFEVSLFMLYQRLS